MTIKVYGLYPSTATARVLVTLLEKEVEYDLVVVDMLTGAHKAPEFLALQPFGQIPVLQDGDLTLFESRAIMRYVNEKYPKQGTALYGSTPEEKALVEQWLEVEGQNYEPQISAIVYQLLFKSVFTGQPTDDAIVAEKTEKLSKVLDVYEAQLAKHKYLAGDFFSLADLSHLPFTHYLFNVAKRQDLLTSRKHVAAWWEDISLRPAWQKVAELGATALESLLD